MATSLQRAVGFNETKVGLFFDELKYLIFYEFAQQIIPSTSIFNADETGNYGVSHKPEHFLKGVHPEARS